MISDCWDFAVHQQFLYLFDTCREVCNDFENVVCFSKILTDVRLLCTNHSDGQTRTYRKRGMTVTLSK